MTKGATCLAGSGRSQARYGGEASEGRQVSSETGPCVRASLRPPRPSRLLPRPAAPPSRSMNGSCFRCPLGEPLQSRCRLVMCWPVDSGRRRTPVCSNHSRLVVQGGTSRVPEPLGTHRGTAGAKHGGPRAGMMAPADGDAQTPVSRIPVRRSCRHISCSMPARSPRSPACCCPSSFMRC